MPLPRRVGDGRFLIRRSGSLLSGLAGYWDLNESGTGTRRDALNISNLTNNNGATQAAGPAGVDFGTAFASASSQSLSIADNAALSTGDISFTLAGWIYLASKPAGNSVLYSRYDGTSFEFLVAYNATSDRFRLNVYTTDGVSSQILDDSVLGSPSTATWYFVAAWVDKTAGQIGLSINAGTPTTTSKTVTMGDTGVTTALGSLLNASQFLNGRLARVGFWKRALTSAERRALYNAGAGLAYSQLGQAI